MRRNWTMEEIDFIKRSSDLNNTEIALLLDRTYDAVCAIKTRFEIGKRKYWSKEDEEILTRMIKDGCSLKKIAIKLERSRKSVESFVYFSRKRGKRINRGMFQKACFKWTNEEIEYLISNYHNTSTKEMSDRLGRSLSSIRYKAQELGVKKDDEFLRKIAKENYKKWKQSWC